MQSFKWSPVPVPGEFDNKRKSTYLTPAIVRILRNGNGRLNGAGKWAKQSKLQGAWPKIWSWDVPSSLPTAGPC